MPIEVLTAIIAALVALLTSGVSGLVTWSQIQRERRKWLTELKTAYSIELYKERLGEYPKVVRILGKISSRTPVPFMPEVAHEVGLAINEWYYSKGGLIADASTRGALLGLRDACFRWKDGPKPDQIRLWRNAVVFSLRRDLDILGLESFDTEDTTPLLEKLEKEMDSVNK